MAKLKTNFLHKCTYLKMAFIAIIILMNIHFFQPKEFIFDREFFQATSPGCTHGSITSADAATGGLFRMLISLACTMAARISILMYWHDVLLDFSWNQSHDFFSLLLRHVHLIFREINFTNFFHCCLNFHLYVVACSIEHKDQQQVIQPPFPSQYKGWKRPWNRMYRVSEKNI